MTISCDPLDEGRIFYAIVTAPNPPVAKLPPKSCFKAAKVSAFSPLAAL
ncbi:MAG: hypothetical protein AAFY33_07760 [Cyanobacteria bacterium J06643_4]